MRNSLLVAALCLSTASFASINSDAVVTECQRQMSLGICMSQPEKTTINPGETMVLSGAGRVSYAAYLDYIALYDPKNPTDSAMCDLAKKYMHEQPDGDHAKIARALWKPISDAPAVKQTIHLFEMGMKTTLIIVVSIFTYSLTNPRKSIF